MKNSGHSRREREKSADSLVNDRNERVHTGALSIACRLGECYQLAGFQNTADLGPRPNNDRLVVTPKAFGFCFLDFTSGCFVIDEELVAIPAMSLFPLTVEITWIAT